MKKLIISASVIGALVVLFFFLKGSFLHKEIVVACPSRIGELVEWVDKKSRSGQLRIAKDDFGSYVFVGNYDVDIDFDRDRYGLKSGATARVVLDKDGVEKSVVFLDNSYCGIAVAIREGKDVEGTFGNMPTPFRRKSPRVGTFCVERD